MTCSSQATALLTTTVIVCAVLFMARSAQAQIPEVEIGVVPASESPSDIEGPPPSEKFPYHDQLSEDYTLYWDFNDTHIIFEMVVRTTGWVGLGISPTGGMASADVIIGWVKENQTFFADRYSEGNFLPAIDSSQDWSLLMGQEIGEYTVLKVVRLLDTCDGEDVAILPGTSRVIYAHEATDPPSDDVISYHGSTRGSKSLLLLDPPAYHGERISLPSDAFTLEFKNRNYSVPPAETDYRCTFWKLPDLKGKHHMIRFEPIIQPGNENLPHHIILYYCTGKINETDLTVSAYNCYEERPKETTECYHTLLGWAIGGKGFDYPKDVGHPFGGPNSPEYFLMETHYDNPNKRSDYVDDSGLRLYLTPQLRPIEAGVLGLGIDISPFQVIPPGQKSFVSQAYCEESCLAEGLGDQEIHIFANLMHMHNIGAKMFVRHIRNGTELPPIMEDNNYDFDYQEGRTLHQEIIVKKGDSLLVDCVYDSTVRTHVTFGGLGTLQEMCFSFLTYYPRVPLSRCQSGIIYEMPEDFKGDIFDLVLNWDWANPKNAEKFKAIIHESKFYQVCYGDQGNLEAHLKVISQPNITSPFVHQSSCPANST